ncbi:MAG TPA: S8 family serine peptidase [Baekduia sp.]|jgi:subtilisin family serine protease|nr:S8 family serine peptidase [Baekduia sp.]
MGMRAALLATGLLAATGTTALAAPTLHAKGPEPARPAGDRLIVAWRDSATAARRSAARAAADTRFEQRIGTTGAEVVVVASGTRGDALDRLRSRADVRYAEPDVVDRISRVPDDPGFGSLWGMARIGAPLAWDTVTDASSVIVAVTDTGVALDHPDLVNQMWHNPGETGAGRETNGVDDDHNGFVDDADGWDFHYNLNNPYDNHYHGTHVSGTIGAAGDNGQFVTGVAWHSTIMPVAVLGSDGTGLRSDIAAGFEYAAANGARIVNASIGGAGTSSLYRDVFGRHPGTLFVVAAGNDNANNDVVATTPCDEPSANVLCVAATDSADARASFSNYGPINVDLAAPGVNILSTIPGDATDTLSGTSMATPHVTGVAALLLAQRPWLTTQQLRTALLAGARPLPSLTGLVASGARLDAPGAMSAARDTTPPTVPALTAPADGAWATAAPTVRWTPATDALSGIAGYDVDVDGRRLGSVPATTTELPVTGLPDGAHTVVVAARDRDGNSSPSAPRGFGIDAKAPTAPTPTTPGTGAVVRSAVLAFTATPAVDDISSISAQSLAIDGRPATTDALGHLPGPRLTEGPHTWSTAAVDAAGNAASSAAVPFTIDDTAPRVVLGAARRVRVVAGGASLQLRASEGAGASVTLAASGSAARKLHLHARSGVVVLGRSSAQLATGNRTVKLRVRSSTLRRLRRAHGLRLRVTVVATDVAGNRRSAVLAGRA